jgi:uncharacterized lipoprotein YddW (UPF0748 family)
MSNRIILVFVVVCVVLPVAAAQPPPVPKINYELVDDFSYSQQHAQRVWEPMTGSKSVSIVESDGHKALRMPCNFRDTRFERASWDRELKLDLTMCKGIQFLFHSRDTSPVASFSMYLHSGNGWYRCGFDAPVSTGWTPIKIAKKAAGIEGRPAGWGKIDTIRISAWRGRDVDTEFYIAALGLFGTDGKIVIVRGDSAAGKAPREVKAIKQYTDVMAQFLDRAGLSYFVLSDLDVTAERLKGTKLIILPHNPTMPDNAADEIGKFLQAGGKLLACYNLPNRLEPIVGIRSGPHIRQKYQGYFASIHPSDKPLEGMPAITRQASWNIQQASAVKGRSRVAAWWHNDKGQSTGKEAIVVSNNCVFLTHVLISNDPANKLQLLLAMVGNMVLELWGEAAKNCLDRVGQFGPYNDYNSAEQSIRKLASGGGPALPALDRAVGLHNRGLTLLGESKFYEAIIAAEKAQESMVDAYCLAQKPLAGEHRAFWCHSAFGVAGMTWDQAIKLLAENGFTAIQPNMLWGGSAFYKSDVLPVSPAVEEKGDQIALCVAACKKYGIECHIWKVNYNMGWVTDKKFMARMKAKGRTQVNYNSSSNDRWLCPSHPDNRKLEIESMLEVARKYDVDGLHFDYIRYPDRDGCFCKGCRLRFEKVINRKVNKWPDDVRNKEELSEKWLDFRREQITAVVAAVTQRAKKIRPDIKISAAVFRNWPVDRNSVGQDWKIWCDRGYLDFVCPMDYTSSSSHFRRMVEQQLTWAGKVPCYPGIGLSVWSDSTDIFKLIEQINITRQLGTGGFTIFNYSRSEASNVLPLLGKGMTRKELRTRLP